MTQSREGTVVSSFFSTTLAPDRRSPSNLALPACSCSSRPALQISPSCEGWRNLHVAMCLVYDTASEIYSEHLTAGCSLCSGVTFFVYGFHQAKTIRCSISVVALARHLMLFENLARSRGNLRCILARSLGHETPSCLLTKRTHHNHASLINIETTRQAVGLGF